jgi:hypothetical protein
MVQETRSIDLNEGQARYFWIKYWDTAEWHITKFWKKSDRVYMKGLDWGLPCEAKDFDNKNYQIGDEIASPV